MIVTVILKRFEGALRFGIVVTAGHCALERCGGGQQRGTFVEIDLDIALQMDGVAGIGAGGQKDRAATSCRRRIDGAVDGRSVDGFAVTFGAVIADIEPAFVLRRHFARGGERCRSQNKQPAGTQKRSAIQRHLYLPKFMIPTRRRICKPARGPEKAKIRDNRSNALGSGQEIILAPCGRSLHFARPGWGFCPGLCHLPRRSLFSTATAKC